MPKKERIYIVLVFRRQIASALLPDRKQMAFSAAHSKQSALNDKNIKHVGYFA